MSDAQLNPSNGPSRRQPAPTAQGFHAFRFDANYFTECREPQREKHRDLLDQLPEKPMAWLLEKSSPERWQLDVVYRPSAYLPSILAGLTGLRDFEIRELRRFYCTHPQWNKIEIIVLQIAPADSPAPPEERVGRLASQLGDLAHRMAANPDARIQLTALKRLAEWIQVIPHPEATPRTLPPMHLNTSSYFQHTVLRVRYRPSPYFLPLLLFYSGNKEWKLDAFKIHRDDTYSLFIRPAKGGPIAQGEFITRFKSVLLLLHQFLEWAPFIRRPFAAVKRLNQFLDTLLAAPVKDYQALLQARFALMHHMSLPVRQSEALWEAFVKRQALSLWPLLSNMDDFNWPKGKAQFQKELLECLPSGLSWEESVAQLNRYKNTELFRIDLSHRLFPHKSVINFSMELSALIHSVLEVAYKLAYAKMVSRHGYPLVKGNKCQAALLSRGHYANGTAHYGMPVSLLLIFENEGRTNYPENAMSNTAFFQGLAEEIHGALPKKSDGSFALDFLPHPVTGAYAISWHDWKNYPQPENPFVPGLHALKPIQGSPEFGNSVLSATHRKLHTWLVEKKPQSLEILRSRLQSWPTPLTRESLLTCLLTLDWAIIHIWASRAIWMRLKGRLQSPLDILIQLFLNKHLTASEFGVLYSDYLFLHEMATLMRYTDSEDFKWEEMGYFYSKNHITEKYWNATLANLGGILSKHLKLIPVMPQASATDQWLDQWIKQISGSMKASGQALPYLAAFGSKAQQEMSSPDHEPLWNNLKCFLEKPQVQSGLLESLSKYTPYQNLAIHVLAQNNWLTEILFREPYFIHYLSTPIALFNERHHQQHEMELEKLGTGGSHLSWEAVITYSQREVLRIGIRDSLLGISVGRIEKELSHLALAILQKTYHSHLERLGLDSLKHKTALALTGDLAGMELSYSGHIHMVLLVRDLDTPEELSRAEFFHDSFVNHFNKVAESKNFYQASPLYNTGKGRLTWQLREFIEYLNGDPVLPLNPSLQFITGDPSFQKSVLPPWRKAYETRAAAEPIDPRALRAPSWEGLSELFYDIHRFLQRLRVKHASEYLSLWQGSTLVTLKTLHTLGILEEEKYRSYKKNWLLLRRLMHQKVLAQRGPSNQAPNIQAAWDLLQKPVPEPRLEDNLEEAFRRAAALLSPTTTQAT